MVHHVGGVVADAVVWELLEVAKETVGFVDEGRVARVEIGSEHGHGGEGGQVGHAGVPEGAADDFLEFVVVGGREFGGRAGIVGGYVLCLGAVGWRFVDDRGRRGADWPGLETGEELVDVAGHGDIGVAEGGFVIDGESHVFAGGVVDVEDVTGVAEGMEEVVLGGDGFAADGEVVDDEREGDAVGVVAVDARDEGVFVVTGGREVAVEFFLGEATRVFETEDGFLNAHEDLVFRDEFVEVAARKDVVVEQSQWHPDVDVLLGWEGGAEVEVLDVGGEEDGVFGDGLVDEGLDDVGFSGVGGSGALGGELISTDGAADSMLDVLVAGGAVGFELFLDFGAEVGDLIITNLVQKNDNATSESAFYAANDERPQGDPNDAKACEWSLMASVV